MEKDALLLRAEEVAKILSLGRSTIFQMLASGELPRVKVGRAAGIPRSGVEAWIRARTEGGENPRPSSPLGEPTTR